jgi:hypothetical protein
MLQLIDLDNSKEKSIINKCLTTLLLKSFITETRCAIKQSNYGVYVTLNRVLLKPGNIKVINISSLKGFCQKRGILFVTNI